MNSPRKGVPLTVLELLLVVRPDRTFTTSATVGIVAAAVVSFKFGVPFVAVVVPFWITAMFAVASVLSAYNVTLRVRRVGRVASWWLGRERSTNLARFRRDLILNPFCPQQILVRAANETSDVLTHPNVPRSMLVDAIDDGWDVEKVLQNPNLDGELIERCVRSELQVCRFALVQWDGCPSDVLVRLCSDSSKRVAFGAAQHPNCPQRGRVLVAVQYSTEN